MTEPVLAVIDDLRRQIAERQAAIEALERIVGVQTLSPSPALNAAPAPAPAPPKPRAVAAPKPQPEATVVMTTRKGNGKVDVERLVALHAQGLHDWEIGEQLGVSDTSIFVWRKKLGLSANSKGGRKASAEPLPAAPAAGPEKVNAAATIVSWLKSRGTIIGEVEPGRLWKVNGRDVIDRAGLLTMANRKRELAKLLPFAWEHE
jgi:hypothetical protein